MPVKKVKGGYKYGKVGEVYQTKAKAERQGKAIRTQQAKSSSKKKG